MEARSWKTTQAFHELMEVVKGAEQLFMEGPRAVTDEASVAEGYRWITQILQVALECYLWGDSSRPSMVPIVGPTMKWGGDNADAYYYYSAIDPRRTYRVRGRKGDAAYVSISVYGGPDDGRWSNRVVSLINDREMHVEPDGSFELVISAKEHPGNWLKLEDDAVALITRDYLDDPVKGRQCSWEIETEEAAPPPRSSDADTARRLCCAANFLRDLFNIFPLAYDETKLNQVEEPFSQPLVSYGWVAADAAYAMGAYDLAEDEALLLEGRSPRCAFWNVCLWNPYLQTYDYRYEQVTLNGGQTTYEADGSWRLVISDRNPGLPNWLSTAGHRRGRIWFRWFLAESPPERPRARLVKLSELRGS
jgi:hypothetical protein